MVRKKKEEAQKNPSPTEKIVKERRAKTLNYAKKNGRRGVNRKSRKKSHEKPIEDSIVPKKEKKKGKTKNKKNSKQNEQAPKKKKNTGKIIENVSSVVSLEKLNQNQEIELELEKKSFNRRRKKMGSYNRKRKVTNSARFPFLFP